MFEKEAEEYGEKDLGGKYLSSVVAKDKLHAYKLGQYDGFTAGAEFGYNKANEWHYVKDEKDLPTDKKEYLLLLGSNIRTFGFYNGKFWESWKGDFSWQEVKAYFFVPVPELKE